MEREKLRVGLSSWLARLAKTGEVPVYAVVGGGYGSAVHRLRLAEGIRLVQTPRHASILLIAGSFTEAAAESIRLVHDQMAGPRITVGWGHPQPAVIPVHSHVEGGAGDIADTIRLRFSDVLTGVIPPEAPLLPNVDAVEWRDVGPYGHGGAGMTGGTPFGRPLALRAPSRDNLELDQLPVTIGPWFTGFPSGFALRVALQGDVAQSVEVAPTDFVGQGPASVFTAALVEPIPIRELEMARARHHLEWMADAFMIAGVDRLAIRADRLAASVSPGDVGSIEGLAAAARRSLLRPMAMRGVGVLSKELDLSGLGPVARASGVSVDLRSSQQAYQDIGFQATTQQAGDAWARFAQRAAEAAQAVELAQRADDRRAFGRGEVEAPDGLLRVGEPGPASTLVSMLTTVLEGMEWGDLVTTIHSLDIDMESVSVGDPAL